MLSFFFSLPPTPPAPHPPKSPLCRHWGSILQLLRTDALSQRLRTLSQTVLIEPPTGLLGSIAVATFARGAPGRSQCAVRGAAHETRRVCKGAKCSATNSGKEMPRKTRGVDCVAPYIGTQRVGHARRKNHGNVQAADQGLVIQH